MGATFAAGFVYFLILLVTRFAGNILRAYLLAPMIGHVMTAMLEMPVVLVIAWVSSRVLIRVFRMRRSLPHAAAMGVITFALLQGGEALLAMLFGDSPRLVLASYGYAPAWFGLAGALILAFFPAIQVALARSPRR